MTRDEIIAVSGERDQWTGRLLDAERAAYRLGLAEGYRLGLEVAWGIRKADALVLDPNTPALDELELRRWGPGGREHFGDPRPGDVCPTVRRSA